MSTTTYACPKCRETIYPRTTLAVPDRIQICCSCCGHKAAYRKEEWKTQKHLYKTEKR